MKKLLSLLLALSMLTIPFASMAEEEKVLNIFSWDGYIDYETVIKPFEQETGIKVNYAPFSTNEEMLKKLQENGASEYDVVLASDYILNTCLLYTSSRSVRPRRRYAAGWRRRGPRPAKARPSWISR